MTNHAQLISMITTGSIDLPLYGAKLVQIDVEGHQKTYNNFMTIHMATIKSKYLCTNLNPKSVFYMGMKEDRKRTRSPRTQDPSHTNHTGPVDANQ